MPFFPAIYTASFLMAFMNCLVSIALALFLTEVRQSTPFIIGLAGFSGNFIYTAMTFLQSRRAFPKKLSWLIYVPAGVGLCYMGLAFVPMLPLFVFLLCAGLFYAFFWPSIQYCFTGSGGEKRTGIFNLSWSAGFITGAFFAGSIYSFNARAPFILSLPVSLASMLLLIRQKKRILSLGKPRGEQGQEKLLPDSMETVIREVRILNFLHFMNAGAIIFLFPKLGLLRSFSPQFIGNILGFLLACRFATFFLLRKKPLLLHPGRIFISCFLFFASCSMVGFGAHPSIVLGGTAIMGITGAFSYHNSLLLHINHNLPTGIHESVIGAGNFAGPLLVGTLGHFINLPFAFLITGTITLAAGLFMSPVKINFSGKKAARKPRGQAVENLKSF